MNDSRTSKVLEEYITIRDIYVKIIFTMGFEGGKKKAEKWYNLKRSKLSSLVNVCERIPMVIGIGIYRFEIGIGFFFTTMTIPNPPFCNIYVCVTLITIMPV